MITDAILMRPRAPDDPDKRRDETQNVR
jgi:hypothetical protein